MVVQRVAQVYQKHGYSTPASDSRLVASQQSRMRRLESSLVWHRQLGDRVEQACERLRSAPLLRDATSAMSFDRLALIEETITEFEKTIVAFHKIDTSAGAKLDNAFISTKSEEEKSVEVVAQQQAEMASVEQLADVLNDAEAVAATQAEQRVGRPLDRG